MRRGLEKERGEDDRRTGGQYKRGRQEDRRARDGEGNEYMTGGKDKRS